MTGPLNGAAPAVGGWVLVTGSSAGIGREVVKQLSADGVRVIAGVLEESAEAELQAQCAGIRVVRFDIADRASRDEAVLQVLRIADEHGLRGLVNNAGIAVIGPTELLPMEQLRRQFEVNFFGAIALTQALLPALIHSGGRVVNVSSMLGRMSLPFAWPYCASKHALEAWSAGLRMELAKTSVRVVTIRPGSTQTRIYDAISEGNETLLNDTYREDSRRYRKVLERVIRRGNKMSARGVAPAAVARLIVRAITAGRPRRVYRVGSDASWFAALQRLLPESVWERLTLWRLHSHKT